MGEEDYLIMILEILKKHIQKQQAKVEVNLNLSL